MLPPEEEEQEDCEEDEEDCKGANDDPKQGLQPRRAGAGSA